MLFDPFEKEFHLPTAFVESADGQRGELKVVCQEHQGLRRLGILEADSAKLLRVSSVGTEAVEHDRLVADQARGPIGGCRVDAPRIHVLLGSSDEKAPPEKANRAARNPDSRGP